MLRRYARALPRLIRLSPGEWVELLRAQWALIRAQTLVWTVPQGRLLERWSDAAPLAPAQQRLAEAERLAAAVSRAARFGVFRPLCLVRALALCRMLEARGIRGGSLRVGVRMVGGTFDAHAWVLYAGHVLGDREEHVVTFAELGNFDVASRR